MSLYVSGMKILSPIGLLHSSFLVSSFVLLLLEAYCKASLFLLISNGIDAIIQDWVLAWSSTSNQGSLSRIETWRSSLFAQFFGCLASLLTCGCSSLRKKNTLIGSKMPGLKMWNWKELVPNGIVVCVDMVWLWEVLWPV